MTWVGTVSGRKVDFLAPDPEQITIEDIATGLSHINRFAGQMTVPYSVAQHSVYCSIYCPSHPLDALMHDAPEAYMSDVPRPLKLMLSDWKELEHRLYGVIATKYGISPIIPPEVKNVDDRMLFTERRDIQPDHLPWTWRRQPYLWRVKPWGPKRAKREFLRRFHALRKGEECRSLSA
jgi:hypothetical protein